MTSNCPHCGEPFDRPSFRLQREYCPNCGKSRHSVATLNTVMRLRFLCYVCAPLIAIHYYFNLPELVFWAIVVILVVIVWRFYSPVTSENVPRE